MFFVPPTEPALTLRERLTVFLIPVAKWSDGTAVPIDEQ
jgi:hypothetical protein